MLDIIHDMHVMLHSQNLSATELLRGFKQYSRTQQPNNPEPNYPTAYNTYSRTQQRWNLARFIPGPSCDASSAFLFVFCMLRSRSPPYSAFTVDMAAMPFLHSIDGCTIVSAEEKPKWYEILKVTEEKLVELILRCTSIFDKRKTEYITNCCPLQTINKGVMKNFRVSNVQETYVFCCIKVAVWSVVLKNHTAERAADLEAMFRRGALDQNLRPIASKMNERFKLTDIAWVGSAEPSAVVCGNKVLVQDVEQECICMGAVWHDLNTHA